MRLKFQRSHATEGAEVLMARYLLDTNIVSFLVRAQHPALDHRFRAVPKSSLAISTVVEAEVRFGLALISPGAKVRPLAENFLREIEIESWDTACAERYAVLAAKQQRLGKPLTMSDAMIAAHALAHDIVLISNDTAFRQVKGLKLEDWTKGPQRT